MTTPDSPPLKPPEPIRHDHNVSSFSSGVPALDHWLRQRAHANEASGASRTYVVCAGSRVVGYYALANGSVKRESAPGVIRQNMPDPVPVMILGRLAVDHEFQRHGIGRGLLRDAILRTLQASNIAGIRAILVHAISEGAKKFYQNHGFSQSPTDPMTLMMTLKEAAHSL